MEKMFNEMMKSYIDKYMQTSDFQKSMLLSMINVFNQNGDIDIKNITEAVVKSKI